MLRLFTHAIAGLTLILAGHAALAGKPAKAPSASAGHKCTAKSHRHAKTVVIAKTDVRGAGAAQLRRTPDVHIFTYGP